MFRKSPAIMKNWEQYGVEYYHKLQLEILDAVIPMLAPRRLHLAMIFPYRPYIPQPARLQAIPCIRVRAPDVVKFGSIRIAMWPEIMI